MVRSLAAFIVVVLAVFPDLARAQGPGAPAGAFELTGGYAGFVDDATRHHAVAGGAARWYVSPRVSIGPELLYMRGPGDDRDLFLTGNLTVDLARPTRRLVPFAVVGGGLMRHSDRFGSTTFASSEGALTGGGGIRGWITERMFVAGDVRLGWELHARTTASVGWSFTR